jgi:hypothetical protein
MMDTQYVMNDAGELEPERGPLTWDGEPLLCQSTVAEGLFDPRAFEQMSGQLAMDAPVCKKCGDAAVYPKYATPDMCERCSAEAWARIDAHAASLPAQPAWGQGMYDG